MIRINRYRRLPVLLLVFLLMMSGCAHTPSTASFIAPGQTDTRYDGFTAYAAFSDLGVRARYERALCEALRVAGHACVPMLQIASPTVEQDSASRRRAMQRSGAQAALVIELADPASDSRRLLANGQIGYRISVIDIPQRRVAARMAIENPQAKRDLPRRADALARAIADTLARDGLLQPH